MRFSIPNEVQKAALDAQIAICNMYELYEPQISSPQSVHYLKVEPSCASKPRQKCYSALPFLDGLKLGAN